ncbi:uncharacterized protein LOC128884341 isoform X2 [Hylaeus volcanicus]|uniref:uncharacterized protein LOC128884341 isoform X2 n=1 Tax=Hylaeus volcanicus TaxID=313075 RepID=UPI0023B7E713|nr:uncharacterized protein LOC128884341 isoform X2 [Hylaeus volcanicus]
MLDAQESKSFTTTNLFEAIVSKSSTYITPTKRDYDKWAVTLKCHQLKSLGINSRILKYLDEKHERLQRVSAQYKKHFYNALEIKKKYHYIIESIKRKHRQKSIYYRQEIQRLTGDVRDAKEPKKINRHSNESSVVTTQVEPSPTNQSSCSLLASGKSKATKLTSKIELLFCNGDSLQNTYSLPRENSSCCKTITDWTLFPSLERTHLLLIFTLLPKKKEAILHTFIDRKKKQTKGSQTGR